jgi:hypothetical protein
MRVAFADDARMLTPLRDNLAGATKQGARWERGRMANAATNATRLLLCGLRELNAAKILAALDAIQPPVAILGVVCIVLAMLTAFTADSPTQLAVRFAPLLAFFLYGLAVVFREEQEMGLAQSRSCGPLCICCGGLDLSCWPGVFSITSNPGQEKNPRKNLHRSTLTSPATKLTTPHSLDRQKRINKCALRSLE